jgi:hypothetical protein
MMIPARPSRIIILLGMACAAALAARRAHADQVTAKGTVLQGKVTGVSAAGVTLETDYGKGAIEIPWKNIEDVTTEGNVQVLYGEGETTTAPLRGYRDGKLLVGSDAATATAIDPSALTVGTPLGAEGPQLAGPDARLLALLGWQLRCRLQLAGSHYRHARFLHGLRDHADQEADALHARRELPIRNAGAQG